MINIKSSLDLTEDKVVKNIDECIKKVENILESIIESTPNNTKFDITVTGEDMSDDTLGWADWHGGYIGLNTKYADTDMVFYLNDIENLIVQMERKDYYGQANIVSQITKIFV
jgi:hypothetical protein